MAFVARIWPFRQQMKTRQSNNTGPTTRQKLQMALLILMIVGVMILGVMKLLFLIDLWTK